MVSSLSSARPLCCPRSIKRFINSSSGTSSSIIAATLSPRSSSIFFRASACGMVRGNPSKITPLWSPKESYTEARMLTIRSSGISCPLSIKLEAVFPNSVPFLISARSTSPVEIWFSPYFSIIMSLCVPLPEPGAPKITIFFIILFFVVINLLQSYRCLSAHVPDGRNQVRSQR